MTETVLIAGVAGGRALLGYEPAITRDDGIEELAELLERQPAIGRVGAATNELVAGGPAP